MKVLVVFVAVACFAQASLASWAGAYGGYAGAHGAYHGPLAAPVVTPSGFLADTPEVAAAKAAHLSLVAGAAVPYAGAGYAGGYAGAHGAYNGPLAAPVVTPSGFLADTPEVAAAKAAHLSLVAGGGHAGYPGVYAGGYAGAYDDGSYHGEGAYSSHYDDAGHYDDGSYKPYLHGHY